MLTLAQTSSLPQSNSSLDPGPLATVAASRASRPSAPPASVLAQRRAEPYNAQAVLALLGPQQGGGTADAAKATRVSVQVTMDNGRRVRAHVVILLLEEGEEPYRVLFWHDDFDAPE